MKNTIENLIIDRDLQSLSNLLREQNNPQMRIQAARALGSLLDYQAVEWLAYSFLLDDSEEVRTASFAALEQIAGKNQVQHILHQYRQDCPPAEEWLAALPVSATGNTEGLLKILSDHNHPELRIKAIQALSHMSDIRIIPQLAHIVRWDDDPRVTAAARAVLEQAFGDVVEEIIQNYTFPDEESDTCTGEDEFKDDLSDAASEAPNSSPYNNPLYQSPVIQEVVSPANRLFLALLILFALAAIFLYLYNH